MFFYFLILWELYLFWCSRVQSDFAILFCKGYVLSTTPYLETGDQGVEDGAAQGRTKPRWNLNECIWSRYFHCKCRAGPTRPQRWSFTAPAARGDGYAAESTSAVDMTQARPHASLTAANERKTVFREISSSNKLNSPAIKLPRATHCWITVQMNCEEPFPIIEGTSTREREQNFYHLDKLTRLWISISCNFCMLRSIICTILATI